jgi:hypothetical protein
MMLRITRLNHLTMWPAGLLVVFFSLWAAYFGARHPWFMNWGATPAEQRMALPGDELLCDSAYITRAVTIHAPASTVWQWMVQIGQDRAGFYSYTWLENLTGADIRNSHEIRPEWQQRAVGDTVPMGRAMGREDRFRPLLGDVILLPIIALEPERLVANLPGNVVLQPIDEQTTRRYLREAIPTSPGAQVASAVLWDPAHFVTEQRMLRGIKERAEGKPVVSAPVMLVARVGWALAGANAAFGLSFAVLLAMVLAGRLGRLVAHRPRPMLRVALRGRQA